MQINSYMFLKKIEITNQRQNNLNLRLHVMAGVNKNTFAAIWSIKKDNCGLKILGIRGQMQKKRKPSTFSQICRVLRNAIGKPSLKTIL